MLQTKVTPQGCDRSDGSKFMHGRSLAVAKQTEPRNTLRRTIIPGPHVGHTAVAAQFTAWRGLAFGTLCSSLAWLFVLWRVLR